MNFPTFAGFAGTHLAKMPDTELTTAAIPAYNDWPSTSSRGTHPGRFIPLGIVPYFDIDRAVAEIHRIGREGLRLGQPARDPLRARPAQLRQRPLRPDLQGHRATTDDPLPAHRRRLRPDQAPGGAIIDDLIVLAPQVMTVTTADIFLSGLLRKFPDLKFALSEGGIGWVPFLLDRLDRHVTNQSWTDSRPAPSPARPRPRSGGEHFLACFITDPTALRIRDRMGVETIAWECDYPHSDSTWPYSPELLHEELDGGWLQRRGDRPDHLEERGRLLQLRPLHRTSPGRRPPSARCGPVRQRPGWTPRTPPRPSTAGASSSPRSRSAPAPGRRHAPDLVATPSDEIGSVSRFPGPQSGSGLEPGARPSRALSPRRPRPGSRRGSAWPRPGCGGSCDLGVRPGQRDLAGCHATCRAVPIISRIGPPAPARRSPRACRAALAARRPGPYRPRSARRSVQSPRRSPR